MKRMKATAIGSLFIVLCAVLALSGCVSPAPSATPTPAPAATPSATPMPPPIFGGRPTPLPGQLVLTINGTVDYPMYLSMTNLRSYGQLTVNETITDASGNTTYVAGTGPSLNALLLAAGTRSSSKNVTFIGSGNTMTIPISAVINSMDATVVILSDGSLRDVIPGQGAGAWVSNLTTIMIS
ncbi:MAG: hypothetical protein WBZ29_06655 [Methanocella sp.]